MDKYVIDQRLRELNAIECKAMQSRGNLDALLSPAYYAAKSGDGAWIFQNQSFMEQDEDISIHRHDRFIPFAPHRHDYLEMIYVYNGQLIQRIDNQPVVVQKGEILLLDMHMLHAIEPSAMGDIAINIMMKQSFFDWIFMKQIAHNDIISNFIVAALYGRDGFGQALHFRTADNPKVNRIMLHILEEYFERRNGMDTAVRAYMILLFNELLRDYENTLSLPLVYKIESSISAEILAYISEHYRDLTAKSIAAHFNYNADYIGKLIKKVTGKTLKELVREKRLMQAKAMLLQTDLPVADIVRETGHSNPSHFYKQFKAAFGMTPDEMRRRS